MRYPALTELPPPPLCKTGWPWVAESDFMQNTANDHLEWPKISIIVPNYNYGHYIEETIRSILLQKYPNLDLIIIDGCSTDNSIQIIKKYEDSISKWISEPDNGQADAINKGLNLAEGEIECYLNSDDILMPNSLFEVARLFLNRADVIWLAGASIYFEYQADDIIKIFYSKLSKMPDFIFNLSIPQSSTFWRSFARKKVGFDTNYEFCLDSAFFCKLFNLYGNPHIIKNMLSGFRVHKFSKSSLLADKQRKEIKLIYEYWFSRYPLVKRIWLFHLYKTWVIRHSLSSYNAGKRDFWGINNYYGLIKLISTYPLGMLNRQSIGALLRVIFKY